MVEQFIRNEKVASSIPAIGTSIKKKPRFARKGAWVFLCLQNCGPYKHGGSLISSFRRAAALLVMFLLSACSSRWQASVELHPGAGPGAAGAARHIALSSERGDRVSAVLGACIEVALSQHAKLPNRIHVSVTDDSGRVLATAQTHDLASAPVRVDLGSGAAVVITPGQRCAGTRRP